VAGVEADVRSADQAGDLAPYQAVVLGSGVYAGQWCKAAASFLKANQQALAARPVWFFSSGPTGTGDPVELMQGWRFPQGLQSIADRIKPRDIAAFPGAIFPEKLSLFERLILKMVKAPSGDFRDWNLVGAWANSIAGSLKAQAG
jgi:menaquinone-dependent protoporphyrinogen oxidase